MDQGNSSGSGKRRYRNLKKGTVGLSEHLGKHHLRTCSGRGPENPIGTRGTLQRGSEERGGGVLEKKVQKEKKSQSSIGGKRPAKRRDGDRLAVVQDSDNLIGERG